ncbi:hypothetical protein IFM47457_06978 [Aspergillus lentulus]|nr:hypothetical protein IFM47457_06978 [Aspergillus lentulus]
MNGTIRPSLAVPGISFCHERHRKHRISAIRSRCQIDRPYPYRPEYLPSSLTSARTQGHLASPRASSPGSTRRGNWSTHLRYCWTWSCVQRERVRTLAGGPTLPLRQADPMTQPTSSSTTDPGLLSCASWRSPPAPRILRRQNQGPKHSIAVTLSADMVRQLEVQVASPSIWGCAGHLYAY